jgi:hypothetical protein
MSFLKYTPFLSKKLRYHASIRSLFQPGRSLGYVHWVRRHSLHPNESAKVSADTHNIRLTFSSPAAYSLHCNRHQKPIGRNLGECQFALPLQ